MSNLTTISDYISKTIDEMDDGKRFTILSQTQGHGLPLVAWKLKDESKFDEFAIAHALRAQGWIVPAYTMAPHSEKMKLLRVVIRSDFSRARADNFLRDLKSVLKTLDNTPKHVMDHMMSEKKTARTGTNRRHLVDVVHSLQGKYGKTHAVC